MMKGREMVQDAIAAEINASATDLALTTLYVYGSEDLAYEIGRYALEIKQDGQILMQDSMKYIVVWEQVSKDNWLIKVDI
jgi:ketosteroid isomerase-like protein|tara:strand:+ start:225 stop:464 length:240 start_codon:yes stop_codon:yes gene_type:complete